MTAELPRLKFLNTAELAEQGESIRWLWDGFLARGMTTLLTSRWKAGKTTLLSVLLSRMAAGGTLAGSTVTPGRAVVVSEEPPVLWEERHRRLGFGDALRWNCRPFLGRPTLEAWQALLQGLRAQPAELYVFDPLSMFLTRGVENSPGTLLNVLEPLRLLTDTGAAVLLVHHPCKGKDREPLSPRGSGALTGFVDVIADLDRPLLPCYSDRVRRLSVASRLGPSFQRTIEFAEDGRDYKLLEDGPDCEGFEAGWIALQITFEDSPERLTRAAILDRWPVDYDKPSKATLARWLVRAERGGLIERHGIGRNHDPYKYNLKGFVPMMEELPVREPLHYEFLHRMRRRAAQNAVKA